jgi:hypothetical protein
MTRGGDDERRKRLAEALRANLRLRKAQVRTRELPAEPDGAPPADPREDED